MTDDVTSAPKAEEQNLTARFARLAKRPGGQPRNVALQRARTEIDRLKPEMSQLIVVGCRDLEVALNAARGDDPDRAQHLEQAYTISDSLREVAGTLGFPFVGLIASNLCTIFETVKAADIPCPFAVLACHIQALQFARANLSQPKMTPDLQELAEGLARTVQLVEDAAAAATHVATTITDDRVH
jgi:hypothetical protein